ncbi:MAG: substrate-binding domain-containing protein [Proteobacteria bacterium]|nr:substrate-binding domain-containing protein [Pseudomonadota bacterium]
MPIRFALLAVLVLLASGTAVQAQTLRLATTTSTANTGLLEYLLPKFRERSGITVQFIAVGTGAALKIAEQGDADVVMVHDREAEDRFMAQGFGINRRDLMYNDFVILGVPEDPSRLRGMADASEALKRIRDTNAAFVSRGDKSGTHMRELSLWKAADIEPKWAGYYLSIGQGMGTALIMAYEKKGYVLSDRGTYIAYQGKINLQVLVEGDKRLLNPYGVIAVNPARHPKVKYNDAMKFIDWLVSKEGQDLIAAYKIGGSQLFFPMARP